MADALQAAQAVMAGTALTPTQIIRADIDKDGLVSMTDALMIVQRVLAG